MKNAFRKNNPHSKKAGPRKQDEWQTRFGNVLRKIRSRSAHYTPDEIEADISRALEEVRHGAWRER